MKIVYILRNNLFKEVLNQNNILKIFLKKIKIHYQKLLFLLHIQKIKRCLTVYYKNIYKTILY